MRIRPACSVISRSGKARVLNRRIELVALHRDGHEFPVEIAITPLMTDGGRHFCAFVRDITERRRSEVTLRQSEQRFRTLAESLPQLVRTCLPDGRCDYLSRQWVEYTGRPEAEQLGYGWAEHLHPDDRERVQAEWARTAERGDVFDIQFRIRRADGVYRWFKTRAVPLRDLDGAIAKWFGSNTDVEELKRDEGKLYAQLSRLNLLNEVTRAIGERQDQRRIFEVVLRNLEEHRAIDFGCMCLYDAAESALSVACVGPGSQFLAKQLALTEQTRIPVDQNGLIACIRGTRLRAGYQRLALSLFGPARTGRIAPRSSWRPSSSKTKCSASWSRPGRRLRVSAAGTANSCGN